MIFAKFLLFTNRPTFDTNGGHWDPITQKSTWCCLQKNWWFRSPYHTKISSI